MKKIILLAAVIGFAATSCKKERTCKCTQTAKSSTTNGVAATTLPSPGTWEKKMDKVSKAGAHCNSGETTNTNSWTSGGTVYTTVTVWDNECSLS